jgi:hypothetical protein
MSDEMNADAVDTRPFAGKCQTVTVWEPGACYRSVYCHVRAGDLPPELRDRLRAAGCGPWVDEDDELLPLGEQVCLSVFGRGTFGPRPSIPLGELVARIRTGPTPPERRLHQREERERSERREAQRRAEEDREAAEDIARRHAAEEAKAEAERRLYPSYCLRKIEELAKVLTKQGDLAAEPDRPTRDEGSRDRLSGVESSRGVQV